MEVSLAEILPPIISALGTLGAVKFVPKIKILFNGNGNGYISRGECKRVHDGITATLKEIKAENSVNYEKFCEQNTKNVAVLHDKINGFALKITEQVSKLEGQHDKN